MMTENQNMCVYYRNYEDNRKYYCCESPGCPNPNELRWKDGTWFEENCRRADDSGWSCSCSYFIKPETIMDDVQTAGNPGLGTKGASDAAGCGADSSQVRRRARERLTYLSQMKTDGLQQNMPSASTRQNAPAAGGQDKEESGLVGGILKAGAKAVIEVGKTAVNPMGAATDFAADVVKQMIDEL